MKNLYLVRHAEAIPRDAGVNDFKRALSKTGENDAQAMGKRLRKKGIIPELLISSPADRALETAHIFADRLGYPLKKIALRDEIYDEDEETLKEIIKGVDNTYNTVMLFGHNPSLLDLVREFLHDFDADIRMSGVVGIAFDTSAWQNISAESATLVLFDFPVCTTPKVYKKAKKVIKHEITSTIEDILESIDVGTSKRLEKIVQKTSKKLAKELLKVLQVSKVEEIAGVRKFARIDNLPPKVEVSSQEPPVAEVSKGTMKKTAKTDTDVQDDKQPVSKKRSRSRSRKRKISGKETS